MFEAHEMGLQDLFARTHGVKEIAEKHKLQHVPGADAEYLRSLQGALRTEHGEPGFLLKPHGQVSSAGVLPSGAGDWGHLYEDYKTRLLPEMKAYLAKAHAPGGNPGHLADDNLVADKFRTDPAYVGRALESALKNPGKTVAQSRLPLVHYSKGGKPVEYRVHVLGGEAPDELAYHRYSPLRNIASRLGLPSSTRAQGSPEAAAQWVRQEVLPRLGPKYRGATYGMDVMRVQEPGGGHGYRLVELNPTGQSGSSGFLDADTNPALPTDAYHWIHGKDAPQVTALKSLGAGALAAGATGSALALKRED